VKGFSRLEEEIIKVGLCTKCGTCVAVCPMKAIAMNYKTEEPELIKGCSPRCNLCYEVCPGKDIPIPEMERMVFGRERSLGTTEEWIGIGCDFIAANATDVVVREKGASGGLVSAVLIYALDNGIIDAAIVAGNSFERPWQAVPAIATTREEVIDAAQTKETLIPTNSIIPEALDRGYKRLGIVGLPCHVHGIRKMQLLGQLKSIVKNIKFVIGLCCGGSYSKRAIEHVIVEITEIPLDAVAKVEYRYGEYPGKFTVFTKNGERVSVTMDQRRGVLFAHEHDRCRVCYDYANDLGDISVGDYFGLEMKRGDRGLSAAILRTDIGKVLIKGAEAKGHVQTKKITENNFFQGGFEWKKHGGAYHILERKKYGLRVPDYHLPISWSPIPRKVFFEHPSMF
jgi:coenzyme F420 hydrogenase subunit beta